MISWSWDKACYYHGLCYYIFPSDSLNIARTGKETVLRGAPPNSYSFKSIPVAQCESALHSHGTGSSCDLYSLFNILNWVQLLLLVKHETTMSIIQQSRLKGKEFVQWSTAYRTTAVFFGTWVMKLILPMLWTWSHYHLDALMVKTIYEHLLCNVMLDLHCGNIPANVKQTQFTFQLSNKLKRT